VGKNKKKVQEKKREPLTAGEGTQKVVFCGGGSRGGPHSTHKRATKPLERTRGTEGEGGEKEESHI